MVYILFLQFQTTHLFLLVHGTSTDRCTGPLRRPSRRDRPTRNPCRRRATTALGEHSSLRLLLHLVSAKGPPHSLRSARVERSRAGHRAHRSGLQCPYCTALHAGYALRSVHDRGNRGGRLGCVIRLCARRLRRTPAPRRHASALRTRRNLARYCPPRTLVPLAERGCEPRRHAKQRPPSDRIPRGTPL